MLEPPPSPNASFAPLVVDAERDQGPRRFRSTHDLSALPAGLDRVGLGELNCSGSAQFSGYGWDRIQEQLGHAGRIHVVDLRQESHGFVDGTAISWYATKNFGAVGLTTEEARVLEQLRLKILGASAEVLFADIAAVKAGRAHELARLPKGRVQSESDLVESVANYVRLPVTDHLRPCDEVLEEFVIFARSLCEGEHVHFHCRGGKGRTSTFMALTDILRNAPRVELDVILGRQAALNAYDLRAIPDATSLKHPYAVERRALLDEFYAFARDGAASWRDWRSHNARR